MLKMQYNSTEYENYYNKCRSNKVILSKEFICKNFKERNRIHYTQDTMIGEYIYNAQLIQINDDNIIIHPQGWKKDQNLKINYGVQMFIAKGYK